MNGKGGIKLAERLDTPTYDELVSIVRSHEEIIRDIYDRTEDKVKQEGAKILLSADMAETALKCTKLVVARFRSVPELRKCESTIKEVTELKELLEAAGVGLRK